jgi:hypothetical protein
MGGDNRYDSVAEDLALLVWNVVRTIGTQDGLPRTSRQVSELSPIFGNGLIGQAAAVAG